MKINKTKHKHPWRVQKGCYVEWFSSNKKGSGIVTQIVANEGTWNTASEVKILDNATNTEIVVNVNKIRIIKTQSMLKKEQKWQK